MASVVKKIFGSRNDRVVRGLRRDVQRINALEAEYEGLDDDALRAKTDEFRQRHAAGESLDKILPEAFAAVREASKRHLGMRHYDVQLIGGIVLHSGKIAEMRTGEGKTLMATLAVYLNAIPAQGVHLVTVNDYLASRDAKWMEPVYNALGLTVGSILNQQDPSEKKAAYEADITYGTNNEFGFDYLRDNMAFGPEDKVQRGLHYAIVDEVDSILIDEARTPLIISGAVDDDPQLYVKVNKLIPHLTRQAEEDGPGDYSVDEKDKQVYLTEVGHQKVEQLMVQASLLPEGASLYDAAHISLMHHINAALRAHTLFQREVDYIVNSGEIVIVDEFTGRTMPGRRWSEGLHQAVEAKEGVKIQAENQTLASITFQNYFRMYEKLSGMTGTADTEAYEFQDIYSLEVVVIPTNRPAIRDDKSDLVYLSVKDKFNAIVEDIRDCQKRGQPVLVGTASIDTSEYVSQLLKQNKIDHDVLNAKQHKREATIIEEAGRPGKVTIATNMAGRGTDIVLGGSMDSELEKATDEVAKERVRAEWAKRHQQVLDAGGLHIVGTERHESRRIDNQLRGRSGRQGDPGSTRFYLSLEDNLLRIFASDRVRSIMERFGMKEGEALEHPWVTKAIENAQRKVEGHNFDIRKQLLEYDDVANDQRKVIYEQRDELMQATDVSDIINAIRADVIEAVINEYITPNTMEEQWDTKGLSEALAREFDYHVDISELLEQDESLHEETLRAKIYNDIEQTYRDKETLAGAEAMRQFEQQVMLQILDQYWKEHLAALDYLRQGIHLRGYAQVDPKRAYKSEAFEMFAEMLDRIKFEAISILSKVRVTEDDAAAIEAQRRREQQMTYHHADATSAYGDAEEEVEPVQTYVRGERKVGRNEPCPCGSGLKYKRCHGQLN